VLTVWSYRCSDASPIGQSDFASSTQSGPRRQDPGRGHPKRDAVGWAIPVLWPVKILTLPARGPRPTLKGEVRITLRLLEDVEVPATVIASRTPSLMPQTQRLTPAQKHASRQPLYAGSTSPRRQAQRRSLRSRTSSQRPCDPVISPTIRQYHSLPG